ncbi:MAG: hypothetical protein M5U28_03060 [Sandaracinaceae bacterium]|nr:hypothetical protein [Sandaracinaceae bacterium]
MSYRDESEALRAKVQDLEGRLEDAQAAIARLRGEGAPAPANEGERSRLIGAPRRVVLERELPFEVGTEGYEAVAAVLRTRFGLAASQVGRRMTAGPFTMSYEGGVTRLRVVLDRQYRGVGLLTGASLLGGFGTLISVGVIHDVLHGSPAHGLWILPIAVAACALPAAQPDEARPRERGDAVEGRLRGHRRRGHRARGARAERPRARRARRGRADRARGRALGRGRGLRDPESPAHGLRRAARAEHVGPRAADGGAPHRA